MRRAETEVFQLAKAKMKSASISFSDAVVTVCAEKPDLCAAYRCEVLGAEVEDLTPRHENLGSLEGPMQRTFRRLIADEMANERVCFGEAFDRVSRAHPSVMRGYRKEVSGPRE